MILFWTAFNQLYYSFPVFIDQWVDTSVLYDGIYKIWYLSCTDWTDVDGKKVHNYHIKYAESDDGINWKRDGIVAIDYKDEYEYAISVPRVIKENRIYKMWFSSRGTKEIPTYRIRYAESLDGKKWIRKDKPKKVKTNIVG